MYTKSSVRHVSGWSESFINRSGVDSSQTPSMFWFFWPLLTGGATSIQHNSCSLERKIIIKICKCSLILGKYKNICFPEIFNCCGGIARKSCDPYKKQGPKLTSCTSVVPGRSAPLHLHLTSHRC